MEIYKWFKEAVAGTLNLDNGMIEQLNACFDLNMKEMLMDVDDEQLVLKVLSASGSSSELNCDRALLQKYTQDMIGNLNAAIVGDDDVIDVTEEVVRLISRSIEE